MPAMCVPQIGMVGAARTWPVIDVAALDGVFCKEADSVVRIALRGGTRHLELGKFAVACS